MYVFLVLCGAVSCVQTKEHPLLSVVFYFAKSVIFEVGFPRQYWSY